MRQIFINVLKAKAAKEAAKQRTRSASQYSNNAGASLASGFVTGYSSQEAYQNTAMSCMNDKGYVFEEMAAEERDKMLEASVEYHKIKHPEQYEN